MCSGLEELPKSRSSGVIKEKNMDQGRNCRNGHCISYSPIFPEAWGIRMGSVPSGTCLKCNIKARPLSLQSFSWEHYKPFGGGLVVFSALVGGGGAKDIAGNV